jgi:hypothetical protein
MVYKFDPTYWNGTIFLFEEWHMSRGWMEYKRENKPIPASYFPKSLTVVDASAEQPDIFHTSRDLIVFSERARAVIEEWVPGEVEFIPVSFNAAPKIAGRLQLASAYYFINVLGRAQRLLWLEMPTDSFPPQEDGIERFTMEHNFRQWKVRERGLSEPLIWHESHWRTGNREYRGHTHILVEDVLWQELDANFPDQLKALRVDELSSPAVDNSGAGG